MELKDYQTSVLDAFVRWRDALADAQAKSETSVAALEGVGADIPDDIRNYPRARGSGWPNRAALPKAPVSMLAVPMKRDGPSHTSVSRYRRAGARRCWPPLRWSGSTAKRA